MIHQHGMFYLVLLTETKGTLGIKEKGVLASLLDTLTLTFFTRKEPVPEYELALPVNNMCIREGRETLFIPSRINMLLTSKSAQGLSIGP